MSSHFPYKCNILIPCILRPIIYVSAKKHYVADRDIDALTKFIVYMLVSQRLLSYLLCLC